MKTVVITGVKQCEIREQPTPRVKEDFCLIRITVIPMCTEFRAYAAGNVQGELGHEAVGEVIDAGPQSKVKVGRRVVVMPQNACGVCALCRAGEHIYCPQPIDPYAICGCEYGRGTYADHCIQRDWLLLPIPEDINDVHAAMALCALGPTFQAVNRLQLNGCKTIAVAGLGPVGLGGVISATHYGARVIGLEPNPYRRQLAGKLGAAATVDPTSGNALDEILAYTDGRGVDAAIETSNVPASPPLLVRATRPRGAIGLVSWGGELPVRGIVGRGLSVFGCWHWNHLTHAEQMWRVIRGSKARLDALITHRFPLDQVRDAWELQLSGQCGKVILQPVATQAGVAGGGR